ncbi:MAG: hypothetical protein L3J05_02345 [Robiginitomaculum sp.]|nr:hypothetical protein [Robiginitomaculum sp.]
MARKYTETGKRGSERSTASPSERMFRRSRAAENRRRVKENKDQRFFRFIFGLAGFGTFAVFIIIIFMSKAAYGQETGDEIVPETALTRTFIGDYSLLDLMGVAFVLVAGYAVYRKYSKKD